jgi:hypothetical protein
MQSPGWSVVGFVAEERNAATQGQGQVAVAFAEDESLVAELAECGVDLGVGELVAEASEFFCDGGEGAVCVADFVDGCGGSLERGAALFGAVGK